ncbi:hypothetical protein [Thermoanaerobacterium sp. R66]|uniref:hypothetical protein n=1 Tax=Thermoanaerobacterium sp. R66 TaxID=2742479 RepID=UPI00237FF6EA|nr:hypothetical protein [Thermoanaerobacterium sp. R66]MDE4543215.1 hypothetical protein [Thermoanaerobacterium sp. R66]
MKYIKEEVVLTIDNNTLDKTLKKTRKELLDNLQLAHGSHKSHDNHTNHRSQEPY